jgi:hypothetical protein
MGTIGTRNRDSILTLFGERLNITFPGEQWKFVVCGGTALQALDLITRTTKDIDVIGIVRFGTIAFAELTPLFLEQISLCARIFDLPGDWFNTGPEGYIKSGLPEGLIERLTWKEYGHNLSIGYISRIDQIFFKLYASVDRGGYHVDDLLALQPTENELAAAARWTCEQDPSEGFSTLLRSMLHQLGFDDVAGKV